MMKLSHALACVVVAGLVFPPVAPALVVRQALVATGADADASGQVVFTTTRSKKRGLRGRLVVVARKLDASSTFDVTVDGVRIGTLGTNRRGKGNARFGTPARPGEGLLGVDPRGRSLVLSKSGAVILMGALADDSIDASKVRCCLPDDSGSECEDRTAAECTANGGIDLGPGSCLASPCAGASTGNDIACCLPDDSGPECEDRTAAQCAAEGGISLGSGTCSPNPCAPIVAPDAGVRCCVPDDSGPHCEDRTVAECAGLGGVNIGAGLCAPNPCLGGSSTSTTLPPSAGVRVSCEKRTDRSRASVNGVSLPSGVYHARLTSGGATATSGSTAAIGGQAEFDFDSDGTDIAAGATAIATTFIQGMPLAVTGAILDAADAVVASATVTCAIK